MSWTDELKAQAIQMYKDAKPTAENSNEIVKEIAEKMSQSPNGVRQILSKAEVYIKKDISAATAATGAAASKTATKRVSKEDSINALKTAIEKAGKEVDQEILDKLTGKAAVYFTSLFE